MSKQLFFIVISVAIAAASYPDIKLVFQPLLFNNAKDYLLPFVVNKTETLMIPDIKNTIDMGIAGLDIDLKNMKIDDLTLDVKQTGLDEKGDEFTLTLKGLKLRFAGDFDVSTSIISWQSGYSS